MKGKMCAIAVCKNRCRQPGLHGEKKGFYIRNISQTVQCSNDTSKSSVTVVKPQKLT